MKVEKSCNFFEDVETNMIWYSTEKNKAKEK